MHRNRQKLRNSSAIRGVFLEADGNTEILITLACYVPEISRNFGSVLGALYFSELPLTFISSLKHQIL